MYPSNKRSKNRMAGPILLRGAKPSNIVAITRCFVPTTGLSRRRDPSSMLKPVVRPRSELKRRRRTSDAGTPVAPPEVPLRRRVREQIYEQSEVPPPRADRIPR